VTLAGAVLVTDATERANVFVWGKIGEKLREIDDKRCIVLGMEEPGPYMFNLSMGDHLEVIREFRYRAIKVRKMPFGQKRKIATMNLYNEFRAAISGIREKDSIFLGYFDNLKDLDSVSLGSAVLGKTEEIVGDLIMGGDNDGQ